MNDLFNNSAQMYFDQAILISGNIHYLRPDWFYAFIPLLLFILLSVKSDLSNKNWSTVVDKQLRPFVLSSTGAKQRRYPLLLVFIASSLCITALAGPVYEKLPQPVYREQSALVVLLDLSQSMNATDIKFSRLSRAKLELLDLLKSRKTGQTALIVYAADAFVVTPLTDDNATIANMVPSLETDMMPAQGSNLSNALTKTFSLFNQAGIVNGDILVITDEIKQSDEDAIKKISSQGHRLSILGIGTEAGAPVPLDGGFLQNSSGAIVIPKLSPKKLQGYALSGGGLYTTLQADNSDTDKLSKLFESTEVSQDITTRNQEADLWREEAHWLLLPLVLLATLWARKGWLVIVTFLILPTLSFLPQPAYAEASENSSSYFSMQHLWSTADQKAMKAFNSGDNKTAAENFSQAEWKASALYRDGNYEAAAEALAETQTSDGLYNKANALAKLGQYEEAIKAYDKALELDSSNEDASYNREQVQQALKEQQQNSEQQDSDQQDSENQDGQQQEDKQQESKQQDKQNSEQENSSQESQQQNSEQESSQQQDTEQQSNEQSDNKDQQMSSEEKESQEQEQLKQRDADAEAEQQKKEDQQYQQNQQDKKNDTEQNDQNQQEQQDANKDVEHENSDEKPLDIEINPMEASITEEEKATEQWLKRIPDDPGGLLRRKFYYQYKQIPNQKDTEEPW